MEIPINGLLGQFYRDRGVTRTQARRALIVALKYRKPLDLLLDGWSSSKYEAFLDEFANDQIEGVEWMVVGDHMLEQFDSWSVNVLEAVVD